MSLNISGIRRIAPLSELPVSAGNLDISNKDLDRVEHLIGQKVTKQNIEQKLKQSGVSEYSIKKIMDSVKSLPDDIDTISFAIIRKDIPEKRRQDMRDILSNNEQDIAKNEETSTAEFDDLLDPENEKEETEKLLFPDGDDSLRPESLAVRQGKGSNDCYFLSSLISLSKSKEGRESIKRMMDIQDNGDVIVSFPGAKIDPKTNQPIAIRIKKPEIDDEGQFREGRGADMQFKGNAIWGQVLEKAFFDYKDLEEDNFNPYVGGDTAETIKLLTGRNSSNIELAKLSGLEKTALLYSLRENLDRGAVVTASTTATTNNNKGADEPVLSPRHAYAVIDFSTEKGIIVLRNTAGLPAGTLAEFDMPIEEFMRRFKKISVSHE